MSYQANSPKLQIFIRNVICFYTALYIVLPKSLCNFAFEKITTLMTTLKVIILYGTGVALIAAGIVLKNKALSEVGKKVLTK